MWKFWGLPEILCKWQCAKSWGVPGSFVHLTTLNRTVWACQLTVTSMFSWQNSASLVLLHFVLQGQICLFLQTREQTAHSKHPLPKTQDKTLHRDITRWSILKSDNHDGLITDLMPDILEWEVKWALASITTNKASGGDGIPVELFQILKDDAVWKYYTQYASKFGKLSSGHRTGKGQSSFQSQRKAMPKNAQTTIQLHSSHMVAK